MNGHTHETQEFEEKVIQISRVSKKTKGGNKVGFSVLMVVGDRKGRVGVGLGKAPDVVSAIKKGIKKAKKKMVTIPIDGTTIPFPVEVKEGAAVVMLKPAPKGSGVIAGGPVRAVVEAAGIRDISSKILGSQNQASNVYATFEALKRIQNLVSIKGLKLRSLAEIEAEEQKKEQELQEKHKKRAASKQEQEKEERKTAAKPVAKAKSAAKPKVAAKPKTAAKPKATKKTTKK
jgi:small subunit ribosomal protein S5